ncbi:hypothetical protein ACFQT0_19385 [Hymenobacter humi]|uniref:Uncharacterized protein n=1 Tax=Hymenobacter humi TaxID=1411620 RepID=A0ABW2U6Z5_9BACT
MPLVLGTSEADYALPCLRNAGFYGDKATDYCGVVNYYNGTYDLKPGGKHSPAVPFLRFIPLLRRVLGAVGYALSGPWLDEPEAQALIIYSDRAVENADGSLPADFAVNRHVPDITIADLLVDAQKFFGLAYSFHPVRRELSIRALRDVITDSQYRERVGGKSRTTAVTQTGFVLKMALEDDELNKTLDTAGCSCAWAPASRPSAPAPARCTW